MKISYGMYYDEVSRLGNLILPAKLLLQLLANGFRIIRLKGTGNRFYVSCILDIQNTDSTIATHQHHIATVIGEVLANVVSTFGFHLDRSGLGISCVAEKQNQQTDDWWKFSENTDVSV